MGDMNKKNSENEWAIINLWLRSLNTLIVGMRLTIHGTN